MRSIFISFILLQLFFFHDLCAQQLSLKKDLRADWMIFEDGRYENSTDLKNVSSLYMNIDAETYAHDKLQIKAKDRLTVFVNGKIAGSGTSLLLGIDSLANVFSSSNLLVAIYYAGQPLKYLSTAIVTPFSMTSREQPALERNLGEFSEFRDFVILVNLLLIAMLAVIIRSNPRLASDYLSFRKIFSLREGENSKMYSRITGSTNLLFYLYCSLIISYFLVIVFYFISDRYQVGLPFRSNGFGDAWVNWFTLSMIVLAILILKSILVFGFSFLFGLNENAGIHFFNLIRVLLVFFGLITLLLFFYFISRGYSEEVHAFFLKALTWFMAGWMVLIFLKLGGKRSTTMFHLFLYICATELIPFLIIVKVLYN